MGKNFFPNKQYNTGSTPEEWEKDMRVSLNADLTDKLYTIKTRTGTTTMQKSPYIEHLISEERMKRLKHELPDQTDDNPGSSVY